MNEPFSLFRKLASRKLAIAILAIVASFEGQSLSTTHMVTLGVVAVAYILAEAFVDRAARESAATGVAAGLADGLSLARRSLGEDKDDPGDPPATGGAPPDAGTPKTEPSRADRVERAGLLTVAIVAVGFGLVMACVPARAPNPACSKERLAAIEAAFVAEAVATCHGYTVSTCADLPKVEAKYRAQREEWVQCR